MNRVFPECQVDLNDPTLPVGGANSDRHVTFGTDGVGVVSPQLSLSVEESQNVAPTLLSELKTDGADGNSTGVLPNLGSANDTASNIAAKKVSISTKSTTQIGGDKYLADYSEEEPDEVEKTFTAVTVTTTDGFLAEAAASSNRNPDLKTIYLPGGGTKQINTSLTSGTRGVELHSKIFDFQVIRCGGSILQRARQDRQNCMRCCDREYYRCYWFYVGQTCRVKMIGHQ